MLELFSIDIQPSNNNLFDGSESALLIIKQFSYYQFPVLSCCFIVSKKILPVSYRDYGKSPPTAERFWGDNGPVNN